MELPKIKKSERGGGMLDGIKSKLGFADANQGYDDGYYDEYGDGYDDEYGEYGPDYQDDAADAAPGSNYDPYAPVSTRPAGHARSRSSLQSGGGFTPPKLVSIDDVRARTQVPESLNRDPLPPRRVTAASAGSLRSERTVVETLSSAAPGTPNARAAAAQDRERSESLNALFTPTTQPEPASSHAAPSPSAAAAGATASVAPVMTGSFDAYPAASAPKPVAARSITVVKPASYGEAERVARALKSGDLVVLALRNTPDNLSKRILDFSFGVSCALDASVDCIADKVFAITRGAGVTDAERTNLRNQGVL